MALERELCAVDAALEKLRDERGAVAEAAASLGDMELLALHGELTARLDVAETQLLALPTSVVEPPCVKLVIDKSALLAGAAVFGRVLAPRAVTAANLTLESARRHAYPGCTLCLRLVLQGAHHAFQSGEEPGVSLGAAAAATYVESSIVNEGCAVQPLQVDAIPDILNRGIAVRIAIPVTAPVGSSVCFSPLTVFGQPVSGLLVELRIEVCHSRVGRDIPA